MNDKSYMLENERISKVLINLSIPATVAMMVNALYNIVDAIFIGRGVGTLAIGALAVVFPIQILIMGFAQMIGIGAASLISRSLGAKDNERVYQAVGNAYVLAVFIGLSITFIGLLFIENLLFIFGATQNILPYAKDYMSIILIGTIFHMFAVCSNNLIRSEGNAKVAMFTMIIGTGLNIILDPIFIFVFKLGVKGAAIATVLSQIASFLFIVRYLYTGKSNLKIKMKYLKIEKEICLEIVSVGLSAFIRQVSGSVVAIVLNNSLRIYGLDIAISTFGIVNRIIMFLFMPLFGVIQGMQPIAGFNYGANKIDRVKQVIKLSIISTTIMAFIGTLFGQLFPENIITVFTKDTQLIKNGASVLRIVISMVPIIGFQIVGAALFQSLGKAIPSIILSLLRQIIFFIPLVLILPRIYNLGLLGIWLAFPISDLLSTIVTAIFLKKEISKLEKVEYTNK
ncbi:putative efflux protein, MATE family [Alkalithermobacter thermoalcaliphilus JW-YL-7 = DSM 7308]|uniref:Multidrug export protein MepA n=1 Tax=Alkalithermobacter thermoalcaliphilus JW-YL-7 = DSM 7308 TaxID=1121328 RepID=A0A150FRI0_CLOPD|nr:MATE efflux family protein [[Clostridium] paradoxum JW-YL-7 = DSM 7308]SHK41909.1 putative efflux protein, MATE family [[Clostridium] paradoxum JW-YL-7 = DSM 7308]